MKCLIMANGQVGYEILNWLLEHFKDDIFVVVTPEENRISQLAEKSKVSYLIGNSDESIEDFLIKSKMKIDLGFLLWWPHILKKKIIKFPTFGFINTHPSFLPYCRGKHYNFWTLVEQCTFGVTLHFIDENIDSGSIVAQTEIPYDWEDNGESLYFKAQFAMIKLFKNSYPKIRKLEFAPVTQNKSEGSFHYAREIESASFIDINKTYKARDLFNLIRARTFSGYPSCWFIDNSNKYEVKIEIKRKKDELL